MNLNNAYFVLKKLKKSFILYHLIFEITVKEKNDFFLYTQKRAERKENVPCTFLTTSQLAHGA